MARRRLFGTSLDGLVVGDSVDVHCCGSIMVVVMVIVVAFFVSLYWW